MFLNRMSPTVRILLGLLLVFLAYSLIYTFLVGNLGFAHDEWRILDIAYHQPLLSAFKSAMYDAKRPLQSIVWILTYKVFGFNDVIFNLISALERTLSVWLGLCAFAYAWPKHSRLIALAGIIVFFFPPFGSLTYDFSLDGVWQGLLVFWLAVLFWQAGAAFRRWQIMGAIAGGVCLALSLLNYEIAFLWFPFAGLLTALVFYQQTPTRRQWVVGIVLWSTSVAGAYIFYWFIRQNYGLNSHSSFSGIPDLRLWLQAVTTMIQLSIPPQIQISDIMPVDLICAVGMGLFIWVVLRDTSNHTENSGLLFIHYGLIFSIGFIAFFTGLLPYIAAGYQVTVSYTRNERIYGAAVFGFALIIAGCLGQMKRIWEILRVLMSLWAAAMVLFFLVSRYDFQQAAAIRQNFYRDLITQVPRLEPETYLLLVDTNITVGNAPVMGWGLRFISIFYDPSVVWLTGYLKPNSAFSVTSEGIRSAEGETKPLDHLVIFQRQGSDLQLVDCIKQNDSVAIDWRDGIEHICTNPKRILPDPSGGTMTRLKELGLIFSSNQ